MPISKLRRSYYFLINFHWYILFAIVKRRSLDFAVWVYHRGWLGIGKLAELKQVPYMEMWQYIRDHCGINYQM